VLSPELVVTLSSTSCHNSHHNTLSKVSSANIILLRIITTTVPSAKPIIQPKIRKSNFHNYLYHNLIIFILLRTSWPWPPFQQVPSRLSIEAYSNVRYRT
jgi:Ca2+/Na+ antiporter